MHKDPWNDGNSYVSDPFDWTERPHFFGTRKMVLLVLLSAVAVIGGIAAVL